MALTKLLGTALCLLIFVTPQAAADPAPADYWLSLINQTHRDPTGMTVVIVPPVYASKEAMVDDTSWVGTDLSQLPAVLATREAIDYWAWMIDQKAAAYPDAAYVTWTTKTLGVDATPFDLANANIVVNTAMVSDPIPILLFHLGLGLPVYPVENVVFAGFPMTKCTVWNTGAGGDASDTDPMRLRNLVLHEFGHCLGVGHTGTSLGLQHCNSNGTCYGNHPDDVMSNVIGSSRQCLSNLNLQSLDEGYAWKPGTTWVNHDGETYMDKDDYEMTCLPSSEFLF